MTRGEFGSIFQFSLCSETLGEEEPGACCLPDIPSWEARARGAGWAAPLLCVAVPTLWLCFMLSHALTNLSNYRVQHLRSSKDDISTFGWAT